MLDRKSTVVSPTLGAVLRSGRTRKGLSLRAVEAQVGISNGYLSLLETDKVKQPSPVHLRSLASLYGISYTSLMGLAGYMAPRSRTALSGGFDAPIFAEAGFDDLTEMEQRKVADYIRLLRAARNATA